MKSCSRSGTGFSIVERLLRAGIYCREQYDEVLMKAWGDSFTLVTWLFFVGSIYNASLVQSDFHQ